MAKKTEPQKEKILSAVSLWKKFDTTLPLNVLQVDEISESGAKAAYAAVEFDARETEDGRVRVRALFARPAGEGKVPAVLLLCDAEKTPDRELVDYFVAKGYAVLAPDYSGKKENCDDSFVTVYPPSLSYADYKSARGLYRFEKEDTAEKSCWFEWTYTALYSLEYLSSRADISGVGVVGVRLGGEVAWKTMLSPKVKCGVTVNAAGWLFDGGEEENKGADPAFKDGRHRYIAGIESQSYAPFIKCPVLMLCACNDYRFDYDKAYDTYARIGGEDEILSAITYSSDSGSCIGPDGLRDLELFLERCLKGRAIYIPSALSVAVKEEGDSLLVTATGDEEGLIEEMGVFYAEAGENTRSAFREWLCVHKDRAVKNFTTSCTITPFSGAQYAHVYAYAKYINGFYTVSKIASKGLAIKGRGEEKTRVIFSGEALDTFSVADHEEYSVGGVFLDKEAVPALKAGYGGILGAYSLGGIKTYKISSPRYVADAEAKLKFDAYSVRSDKLRVSVDITGEEGYAERYSCILNVKGGGKWKRTVLNASDFKNERLGKPLKSFALGSALVFDGVDEENELLVTNVLWL
ncbi:MAG: dienelactone hydrolase family protein [Clostridia bacterium]|nr:dienelactone hydrolase family protein [Clostridia bacterium]